MAGYTSEEKQAVIDRFLLGRVSTPRTSLGARDVLTAREDVYSLLTTTLLLKPDSYFYAVWLAKNRLEALRRKQVAALEYILADSTKAALGRRGRAVKNTAELTNAQAALLNLNSSLNSGTLGSSSRELGPEVSRFRRSIERFVRDELQNNVVEDGEITETADEVRSRIRSLWTDCQARHEEMVELAGLIRDAISNLSQVRLPEKAVQSVVTRLRERLEELSSSLETDKSLTSHREAMLELLVMRTLLTRVSSFRIPQEVLAPLSGDSPTVSGVRGTTPASITATVSGGYNLAPSDNIEFESGSPVVPTNIVFGDYSNAEMSSRDLTFPLTFGASAVFRIRVDGTLYADSGATFAGTVYASLAALLADITTYLTTVGAPVTASSSGSKIVLRSDNEGDDSSIEIQTTTPGQREFIITMGFPAHAVCAPISVERIIELGATSPGVRLSESRVEHGRFEGLTSPGSVLDLSKTGGSDLQGTGTTFSASASNFESLGVKPGDYIFLEPQETSDFITPAAAESHRIAAVSGGTLTLATELTSTSVMVDGTSTYRIGPDLRDVPAGARVEVLSRLVPLNTGPYRVVSGAVGRLTLDRGFYATTGDPVSAYVYESYLVVSAPGAEAADGVTAFPASTGATALGFTATATQERAQYTELEADSTVDFLARGVAVGDRITLATTPETEVLITSVGVDTLGVEGVDYFSGSVEYTIRSARYVAWSALSDVLGDFLDQVEFEDAEFSITRLVSGAAPTTAVLAGLDNYETVLTALADVEDYVVPFERTIDNILRMLVEKGMDRAADLLTSLQIVEFFSMHPDGVSYPTHLIRVAADVTRQVAPVSRFAKSLLGSPEVQLRSRRFRPG